MNNRIPYVFFYKTKILFDNKNVFAASDSQIFTIFKFFNFYFVSLATFVRRKMRTRISKILMCFAALAMLLMSAVPHHHHCFGADHSEYICFASLEQEQDCCLETENEHACHLHSIVTLIGHIQNAPQCYSPMVAVVPEIISLDNHNISGRSTEYRILTAERLLPLISADRRASVPRRWFLDNYS